MSDNPAITIYHNPKCGTSRNTLAMLRAAGIAPQVIDYQRQPPGRARLCDLLARAGLTVRDVLRQKGTPHDELGLGDPALDDDALLDAIAAHPILINRPLVETPLGVRLCRPSETVLDLLTPDQRARLAEAGFIKEDGQVVLPKPA